MSTGRIDTNISDYFNGVTVTASMLIQGALIPLHGAAGLHITAQTTNGAAGSLILYTSSQDPAGGPFPSQYPFQAGAVAVTVAANSANTLGLGPNNTQLYARYAWLAFNPSASGTLYVAVNIRRWNA